MTAPAAGDTAGSLAADGSAEEGVGMKVEVVVRIFVEELAPTTTTT